MIIFLIIYFGIGLLFCLKCFMIAIKIKAKDEMQIAFCVSQLVVWPYYLINFILFCREVKKRNLSIGTDKEFQNAYNEIYDSDNESFYDDEF